MFTVGHIFPVYTAGMVGGCAEWTIPHLTNAWRWTGPPAGKRGMVRAGGSASRTIDDSDAPDPGGGHHPAWRQLKLRKNDVIVWLRLVAIRVVARNSTMGSISRSEQDGGRMAPLGRNVGVPRRMAEGATDGSSGCQGCKGKVRRTASVGGGGGVLSYTGPGNECNIWTEDHVQRSRWG